MFSLHVFLDSVKLASAQSLKYHEWRHELALRPVEAWADVTGELSDLGNR